jgi:quercetin dioxygenase-like cupin family protein
MDPAEKHMRRKLRDLRVSRSGTRRAMETVGKGTKANLVAKLAELNRAIAELEGQIELFVKRQRTPPPVMMKPSEGRTIGVVGDIYRFLATSEDTAGRYAMWEAIVPPGGGPPPHIHSREEEAFFVLEGEVTFHLGEERFVAGAGTFANMPVGSLHSFKNEAKITARMLITVAPAGLEKMFFEVGQPVEQGATSAPMPTKADFEKLMAAAPLYGIEIRVPKHLRSLLKRSRTAPSLWLFSLHGVFQLRNDCQDAFDHAFRISSTN